MKLYYPYFNLFRSVSTKKYALELVIKIPGKGKIGEVSQSYEKGVYNVTFPVLKDKESTDAADKTVFERVKLTPENDDQLKNIKIIVEPKETDATLLTATTETKDPDPPGGGGNTSSGDAEDERP